MMEDEDNEKSGNGQKPEEEEEPVQKRERPRRKAATKKKKPDSTHYIGYVSDNISVEEIERKFARLAQIQEEQNMENEQLDDESLKQFYETAVDCETHKEIQYLVEMDTIDNDDEDKDKDYDFNEEDAYDDDIDEYVEYPSPESGGYRRGKKRRKGGANLALLKSLFPYRSFTGRLLFRRVLDSSKNVTTLIEPKYDSFSEKLDPAQIRNHVLPPVETIEQEEEEDEDFPETMSCTYDFDTNLDNHSNWKEVDDMFKYEKHLKVTGKGKRKKKKKYHVIYISAPQDKYGDSNLIEDLDLGDNSRFESCYLYIWMISTNFQDTYTLLRRYGFQYVESVVWIKLDLDCDVKTRRHELEEMEERQDNCECLYMFKRDPRPIPKTSQYFRKHQRWVDCLVDVEFKGYPHYYPLRLIDDLHPIAMKNKEVLWLWGDPKYTRNRHTSRMDVLVETPDDDEEEEEEEEEEEDED